MSSLRPATAKIIQHAEGLGTPTSDTVRQRARELALINGHAAFSEQDWQEARHELHGGHPGSGAQGDIEMQAMVSESDMIMGSLGRHAENMPPEDAESVVEELVAEGMDEAVHEQMLAARLGQEGDLEDED